ncbi:MAG TPA: hypothetical protein VM534_01185 [Thermoanaerobaculia bacterium]|nr:hypothetical protein [Thermoanaerobaculia bacterium]
MMTRSLSLLLLLALFVPVHAPAQETPDELLRNLLTEIRLLRKTMERSNLFGLQGNLLIERIRGAQTNVSDTRAELTRVRGEITALDQEKQNVEAMKEQIEERLRREFEPELLEAARRERAQFEPALEIFAQRQELLRRNEQEILARLEEEEEALATLEEQFDRLLTEIERTLRGDADAREAD